MRIIDMATYKPGDTVYVLNDYRMYRGVFVKYNKTTATVVMQDAGERRIPNEKIAAEHETICIVWEMWKGKNGRGGYRLEREMYQERHEPAYLYHPSKLVWEVERPS